METKKMFDLFWGREENESIDSLDLKHLRRNEKFGYYEPNSWHSLRILKKLTSIEDPIIINLKYARTNDRLIDEELKKEIF